MRIVVCLDLVSGSKQIKVNRYVKKSIYISHYLHNLMKFSLHNLLDFELKHVISKLGPTDSYDDGSTDQSSSVMILGLERTRTGRNKEIKDQNGPEWTRTEQNFKIWNRIGPGPTKF